MQIFYFRNFFLSIFQDFREKTYEKTCRFYNIFSKYNSSCPRLPGFMLWVFFSEIWWPFQFNGHFFWFPYLWRENLWKDLQILWLIFKDPTWFTRSQKYVLWKFVLTKWRLFQNVNNFLFISATLSNICVKTYKKTNHFCYLISNFNLLFT